jgi:hypothetical protein
MSKINCDFKLKDLYAIKHALEDNISCKNYICKVQKSGEIYDQYTKDIEHDKKIVDYIVEIISKYKPTEQHYGEV